MLRLLTLALLLSPALRADDDEARADRIRAEMNEIERKEKEIAAAIERETTARREELAKIGEELARMKETHTLDHPRVVELTARAERIEEHLAGLEARRASALAELAAARERLQDAIRSMRRAAAESRPPEGKRVTIAFDGTPIRDALARLAKDGGADYVFLDACLGQETVTGAFDDVPAGEVAAAILESAAYEFSRSPSGVLIVWGRNPKAELTALDATRLALQTQVAILELEARRRELQRALDESK